MIQQMRVLSFAFFFKWQRINFKKIKKMYCVSRPFLFLFLMKRLNFLFKKKLIKFNWTKQKKNVSLLPKIRRGLNWNEHTHIHTTTRKNVLVIKKSIKLVLNFTHSQLFDCHKITNHFLTRVYLVIYGKEKNSLIQHKMKIFDRIIDSSLKSSLLPIQWQKRKKQNLCSLRGFYQSLVVSTINWHRRRRLEIHSI